MSALARLQRDFQRHIFHPDARFEGEITTETSPSARERLGIYARAYRARLLGAIGKDYPGLKALLGNDAFERIALAYIATHPSRHTSLRWYGGDLAAYLRKTQPRRRALAEMAGFEWALGLAFDAADAATIGIEDLAAVPAGAWPRLRFIPHPSVRRMDLRSNASGLRAATDDGKPLPGLRQNRRPVSWLIWRKGWSARSRPLQRDEARALDLLLSGGTFGAACEQLAREAGDGAPLRAASLLESWLSEGLFAALKSA